MVCIVAVSDFIFLFIKMHYINICCFTNTSECVFVLFRLWIDGNCITKETRYKRNHGAIHITYIIYLFHLHIGIQNTGRVMASYPIICIYLYFKFKSQNLLFETFSRVNAKCNLIIVSLKWEENKWQSFEIFPIIRQTTF